MTPARYLTFWGSLMTLGLSLGGVVVWQLWRLTTAIEKLSEKLK